jgi:Cadherin-like beta sandwich domain
MKWNVCTFALPLIVLLAGCVNPGSPAAGDGLPPSTDCALSSLVVSAGLLSPAFAPDTTAYSVAVPDSVTSFAVTPAANENHATIKVNGAAVTSGISSSAVSLASGLNTITIEVTAQGGQVKSYALEVTRLESGSVLISIVTPQDIPVVLSGQTTHVQKPDSMTVSTTFAGAQSYSWRLDGAEIGTLSSVTVSSNSMDVGGPYSLALIVGKNGQVWSGTIKFMIEN